MSIASFFRVARPVTVAFAVSVGLPIAQAQTVVEPQGAVARVKGVVSIGVMGGGDTISSFEVSSWGGRYNSQDVDAGGNVDVRVGVEFPLAPAFSLQATIGYATGGIRADNGRATFTTIPVEVLGHYAFHPAWRMGLGLRAPTGAEYREGGVAGATRFDFSSSVTPVVEVEWLTGRNFGLKLRGMRERYKEKASGFRLDGNTVGLTGSFYF